MNIIDLAFISDQIKREIFHKTKLNMSQVRLICFFANNGNQPVAMGDLAQNLQISPSTLSRQLHQPKTAALLKNQKVASSSSKMVCLNSEGEALATDLKEQLNEINNRLLEDWEPAETEDLSDKILRLRSSLEKEF
jgi:DNA-binding MarR family transcriptional regulator